MGRVADRVAATFDAACSESVLGWRKTIDDLRNDVETLENDGSSQQNRIDALEKLVETVSEKLDWLAAHPDTSGEVWDTIETLRANIRETL